MIEAVEKTIGDMLGSELIISADSIIDTPKHVYSISPSIDVGLNGGIPEGTWMTLSGIPKTGKTTLALEIISQAQANGKNGYYFDVEYRLKQMNLLGAKKLQKDKFRIIRSSVDKILSGEEYLDAVLNVLKMDPGCVVCIDSVAALCTAKEMKSSFEDSEVRTPIPKLMARFVKNANQIIGVNKNIIILVAHLGANPTPYGPSLVEKGGYEQMYQADIRLQSNKFEKIEKGNRIIGQICHWKVLCSALGPPFAEIPMRIIYGNGIDRVGEMIEIAIQYGIINKGGAWFKYGDNKWQGFEKTQEALTQNPELLDEIWKKTSEIVFAPV